MATSRRTGTNENVSTYGAAGQGRDYTVLNTWEAATDIDLVTATQSEVLECYNDTAEFDDDIGMVGATTSALYFRILRPAGAIGTGSWEGHDGTPNNGFKIHNTASAQQAIQIEEDYSSAQDIIIQQTNPATSTTPALDTDGLGSVIVGMILVDITSANDTARGLVADGGSIIVNCIVIRADEMNYLVDNDIDGLAYFLNCHSIDAGTIGFNVFSGTETPVFINNLSHNSGTFDFDTDENSYDYCASTDATAVGTGARINQTFSFVASGSDDYHLTADDTGAKGFGSDLSAYGVFPFDDDIDGQTRS